MKSIKRSGMAAGSKKTTGRRMPLALAVMLAAALVLAFAPVSQSSPGWTTPENISPGTVPTGNREAQIALDSGGHPHAVWYGHDGSTNRIYYSENSGSGWTAPLNISPGTTTDNLAPQIALDSVGNPHVVWYGNEAGTLQVYYSENTGSGWAAPLNISPGTTTGNQLPQIALGSGDNPHVVWQGYDGAAWRIYYSVNTGSGWAAPLIISPGTVPTGNQKAQIALDAGGHPHAVWRGDDVGSSRIWYSANTGGGWATPLSISPGSTSNDEPQIALDTGGHPHAVWWGYDSVTYQTYYSENTGSGWTSQSIISSTTTGNDSPQIALDAGGNPHVVWRDDKMWIYYSKRTGSGWTTPQNLSPSVSSYNPQITLDSGGNPHAVWWGWDSVTYRIYYSENIGSGWSAPLSLSTSSTTNNMAPQIALDSGGNPHVVWSGDDGSTWRTYYSEDISTYRVTAAVSGRHGSVDPASQWVARGSSASIDLVPDSGYQVASITDNGVPQAVADPYAITNVTEAHDVVVTFAVNDFYFAEGYTGSGFQEYLCLGNPGDAPLKVKVTYLVKDGDPVERTYDVPPLSRFTADVNSEVGPDKEVSIKCSAAAPFIAERPMYFEYTGGGGSWTGGSDAVGATRTSQTWYFAEGYTGPGFDEWICVLNPGDAPANLTFNFQTQEDGLVVPTGTYTVPAHSRGTFKANDLLGGKDYQTSLALASDVPVVAERPMYFDYQGTVGWGWTGGHDVLGVPALGRDYYFAEGTTRTGFEEWLTLQNPGAAEITVNAVYQLGEGTPVPKEYKVPAGFRKTVYVPDEVGAERDVSVHLSSSSDFLAERPMYFNYQGTGSWGWTGGHCVIGAASQGTDWFFAEGYTGAGFEEWLCIQNPGAAAAKVTITYYPQGGGAPIKKDPITVAANSRYTVYVNSDAGEGLSICSEVASDKPVIVERPMYFNFQDKWDGGSDVVGYLP